MRTHFNEGHSVLHGVATGAYGASRNASGHIVPIGSHAAGRDASMPDLLGVDHHPIPETMRNVLIVGDSPGLCAALARALAHPRLRVRTTDVADLALAVLARGTMDFVIAERPLRVTGGADLLEVARREFPEVPRVLLAGNCDVASIRDAINRCGISFFLPKPWDAHSLRELVDRLLLAEWPHEIPPATRPDIEDPPVPARSMEGNAEGSSESRQDADPLYPVEEE